MAAGLGSRFGGLKQIAPVDEGGHIIIDYSLYDAYRAGFRDVVCIINPANKEAFDQRFKDIKPHMNIQYAYQTLDALPEGYTLPEGRTKPWGTAHAILCAKPYIHGPFAAINADDFYGEEAYKLLYSYLESAVKPEQYAMVGYMVENTLSESGSVARGVCAVAEDQLVGIKETFEIVPASHGGAAYPEGDAMVDIPKGTVVSMNIWAFDQTFMDHIESRFEAFLDAGIAENPMKCEFLLPTVVGELLAEKTATVRVLPTTDKWYGVTYAEDLPAVKLSIQNLIDGKIYPKRLWGLDNLPEQAYAFNLSAKPIFCTRYGNGHINETYLIVDAIAREYILQKINKNVFRKPENVMDNLLAVTSHLRAKAKDPRTTLTLLPTKDGNNWLVDDKGEYWRMYPFISDTICLQRAEDANDFKESGAAFGNFQKLLADFPAETLNETIPDFHNTPARFAKFEAVIAADPQNRAQNAQAEIAFALARKGYVDTLVNLQAAGDIPLRVTHNDTKLNNVLFDRETRCPLCVIDLDTVMPGLSVNDFGDSVRFGASTGAEDEVDLSKISFSLDLYKAYAEGFLSACGDSLTPGEIAHLRDGAKMMTLECGLRFLTDYIEGDVYFKTDHAQHNLDRARTQFKLVADMEQKWEQMGEIVREIV